MPSRKATYRPTFIISCLNDKEIRFVCCLPSIGKANMFVRECFVNYRKIVAKFADDLSQVPAGANPLDPLADYTNGPLKYNVFRCYIIHSPYNPVPEFDDIQPNFRCCLVPWGKKIIEGEKIDVTPGKMTIDEIEG